MVFINFNTSGKINVPRVKYARKCILHGFHGNSAERGHIAKILVQYSMHMMQPIGVYGYGYIGYRGHTYSGGGGGGAEYGHTGHIGVRNCEKWYITCIFRLQRQLRNK